MERIFEILFYVSPYVFLVVYALIKLITYKYKQRVKAKKGACLVFKQLNDMDLYVEQFDNYINSHELTRSHLAIWPTPVVDNEWGMYKDALYPFLNSSDISLINHAYKEIYEIEAYRLYLLNNGEENIEPYKEKLLMKLKLYRNMSTTTTYNRLYKLSD